MGFNAADWDLLKEGLLATLSMTFWSLALALPLGLALGLVRYLRIPFVSEALGLVIDGIRIMPLILYLVLMFLILPLDPVGRAIFTLATFNAANIAEVIRGGLMSVPEKEHQAARSLGLSPWQAFQHVVLPQVVARMIPALINQASVVVKDTTLVSMGVLELTKAIQILNMRHVSDTMGYMLLIGIVYFALSYGICALGKRVEVALTQRQTLRPT